MSSNANQIWAQRSVSQGLVIGRWNVSFPLTESELRDKKKLNANMKTKRIVSRCVMYSVEHIKSGHKWRETKNSEQTDPMTELIFGL